MKFDFFGRNKNPSLIAKQHVSHTNFDVGLYDSPIAAHTVFSHTWSNKGHIKIK
uniref:Uncharacterized protein n=1 Tax=Anguilla anguilla TaxID=7936 RepID=A0A0E9SKD0_ANGAN